jgi:hypothetical protein
MLNPVIFLLYIFWQKQRAGILANMNARQFFISNDPN